MSGDRLPWSEDGFSAGSRPAPEATPRPGRAASIPGEHPAIALLRRLANPVAVVMVLFAIVAMRGEPIDGYYVVLAIIAFFVSSYLFDDLTISGLGGPRRPWSGFGGVLVAWLLTVAAVLFLGFVTRLGIHFDRRILMAWFLATPVALLAVHLGIHCYVGGLHRAGRIHRALIVGANSVGERLARRLIENRQLLTEFAGFVDDRAPERLSPWACAQHSGPASDIQELIGTTRADVVYVALPISQKDRIQALLDRIRDSTASVYLVPDIFTYDLIQARIDQVGGVPVIGILETPFTELSALNKRLADVVIAGLALSLLAPVLAGIALLIKLSSPGPVIFKQRRYGLNGEEITVYKFRTMRVTEDGPVIRQATRDDDRVTPIGRILRRTSLDELPQFVNVLQGQMSVVGPRPHAVAHNELYRKLISGYMVRHKAKPGITGWAQVNGFRGETDTVDKMAGRIQYDLDYLRNWSLWLDLVIILKTVGLVFRDARAY